MKKLTALALLFFAAPCLLAFALPQRDSSLQNEAGATEALHLLKEARIRQKAELCGAKVPF